ncbi:PH domain protein, partial [Dictyocaulus viviparus]
YEWSNRAKRREIIKHVQAALETSVDHEVEDDELEKLLTVSWDVMFEGCLAEFSHQKQKYLQAVWELFHSELKFLHHQLLVLRNVYKEPLKKCQVEGCLLTVEPDLLFGNLDQLCRISRGFCQTFLTLLQTVNHERTDYDCTELVVKLFEKFSKGPSTISAYQAYCINYKATMEYLGSIRQKEERFTEFERICMADERCFRLQLEDLLIAPLQRITRLPLFLREIHKFTEKDENKAKIEKVIESMTESLKVSYPHIEYLISFIMRFSINYVSVLLYYYYCTYKHPHLLGHMSSFTHKLINLFRHCSDLLPIWFLKVALSRQFCENLLAHPRRKLIHEGMLELVENGRTVDCYAFLFNDMFVLTKTKKCALKLKMKGTAVGKTDHYVVQRQPVPLDSCVFCDADSNDSNSSLSLKFAFVIIHLTRYYQVVAIYTLQAADKHDKELWIEKFQESIENYESIQLKDMLKCTPLFSSLSLRRCSSSRLMTKNTKEKEKEKECCELTEMKE